MYKWQRYGGYEVSSKGDKRFSAFYARLADGRTVEEAYQLDIKGYRKFGNNAMVGKGKAPLVKISREELYLQYKNLWKQWCKENPKLVEILKKLASEFDNTLSDMFANTDINQARALADCLNESVE